MSNIHALEPQAFGLITFKTTFGDLDIELFIKQCPGATRNFVQLCLDGYYRGTIFERVERDFIAIGGCQADCDDDQDPAGDTFFPDEFHSRLRFTRRGLLATANTKKNENGPKFFFTLGATPELQNKHTIFGRVIGNSIYSLVELNECHVDEDDRPIRTQTIDEIIIVENPFPELVPRKQKSATKEEAKLQNALRDVYDPLDKPKPAKSKKLSFYNEDDSDNENDEGDGPEARQTPVEFAKPYDLNVEPSTSVRASSSSFVTIPEEANESPTDKDNEPTLSEDDKIVAKERRLREIKAEIQSLKEQIEKGSETKINSDKIREESGREAEFRRRLDGSSTEEVKESINPPKWKKNKHREQKTIELVTNFRKELKEASKRSRDTRLENHPKKTKVDQAIDADDLDLAALDELDDDAWMAHKFEADD